MRLAGFLQVRLSRLLLGAAVVALAACGTPAQRTSMEVPGVAAAKKNNHSVTVNVSGGQKSDGNAGIGIVDADFKAAIEASLLRAGAFGSVQASGPAGYTLSANIIELRMPAMGFSMTVDLEVAWTLARSSDGAVLMRKAVRNSFTAGVSDAFAGVTRVRLAVEGAARGNVQLFLKELEGVAL